MKLAQLVRPNATGPSFPGRHRRAFSLVEIVLALGVFSFCLLTLIGLTSLGFNNNTVVREQITALNLSRQIESDLQATAAATNASPLYNISIPAAGGAATTTLYDSYAANAVSFGAETPSSQYRFTITLTGPPVGYPNDPVNARIQATWPPQITPLAPSSTSNPTNVVGTVNLDVAVNRFGS